MLPSPCTCRAVRRHCSKKPREKHVHRYRTAVLGTEENVDGSTPRLRGGDWRVRPRACRSTLHLCQFVTRSECRCGRRLSSPACHKQSACRPIAPSTWSRSVWYSVLCMCVSSRTTASTYLRSVCVLRWQRTLSRECGRRYTQFTCFE